MVSGEVGVLSVAAMAAETEKVESVMPEKKPAAKGKTTKEKKAKGTMKKKKIKAPMNHPPYRQMITEAIFGLKERSGSSQQAISKFIEEKYKADLPPNFRRLLLTQLKNLTKAGHLARVKNSFKLSDELKKTTKASKPQTAGEAKTAQKVKPAKSKPAKSSKVSKPAKSPKPGKKMSTPRKVAKSIKTAKRKAPKSPAAKK